MSDHAPPNSRQDEPLTWMVTMGWPGSDDHAVFVEAADEAEAARKGTQALEDFRTERGDEEPLHNVWVGRWSGVAYRVTLDAERVPDKYQCCGGMPHMASVGTYDEHTAPCLKARGVIPDEPNAERLHGADVGGWPVTPDDQQDQEGGSGDAR